MMAVDPKLQNLRDAIDAIDDQLLALLRERSDIVEQVRGVKGKLPIYIRPGREADMLRALLVKPQGHIPAGLIHRLWREMIGAFTLLEGKMQVVVAVPEGEPGLWDMARDHFGSFTPMQALGSAITAMREVASGKAQVAILPTPKEGDSEIWWRYLLGPSPDHPNVFYRIPFDGVRGNARAAAHDAVVVASLKPEATAADRTVLVIEWNGLERRAIEQALAGFPWQKAVHVAGVSHEPPCSWLEAEGFYTGGDESLKNWLTKHKDAILRDRIVGAYPVPLA